MKIGSKLKELRVAHDYTQEELAIILNVSRSTISSWEINRTYPDISILVSLSELYNITVDQLINEDDQLVDTMANQTKKNDRLKKIIVTLIVFLLSFAIVFVFILMENKTSNTPEITHYAFSDYSEIVKKEKDGDNSIYFYDGYFIGKIIDTLPNGTKTTLVQPTIANSMFNKQATLKVKRDENHEIRKVSVSHTKSTIQLLQDEYGGHIRMAAYDSWEESEKAIEAIEASNSEKLVFIKSDDGTTFSAFFKANDTTK